MATVTTAVNQPPIAKPGGPYSGPPAQSILLNGSASSDPDGSITSYAWSFGDGTPTQTCKAGAPAPPCGGVGAPATVTHAWAGAGNYTVTLTVTDNAGATGTATTTATLTAVVSTPAAPTGLVMTAYSKQRQVTLKWTDNAGNESGFKIERSADGVTFTEIATVGPNVVTFAQGGVKKTTYYRVRAYNSAGNSAYSNTLRVP
jgi:PKD repeat protein